MKRQSTNLAHIGHCIDQLSKGVGELAAWMACIMVVLQAGTVLFRYVFGVNLLFIQDAVLYLHAFIFLLGSAATLAMNGHVRVDVIFRSLSERQKAWVDCLGIVFFLFPFCIALLLFSLPYITASWGYLEGARETTGLHLVFLLKTAIAGFALLLILQGISILIRRISTLGGSR